MIRYAKSWHVSMEIKWVVVLFWCSHDIVKASNRGHLSGLFAKCTIYGRPRWSNCQSARPVASASSATSLILRHWSYVTDPTSLILRHWSYVTDPTSLILRQWSYVTDPTSLILRHWSYVTDPTLLILRHWSYAVPCQASGCRIIIAFTNHVGGHVRPFCRVSDGQWTA